MTVNLRINQIKNRNQLRIYEFHISKNHHSSLGWFIWTQHIYLDPVGLLAQLEERCTGVAKVMGSNPVEA